MNEPRKGCYEVKITGPWRMPVGSFDEEEFNKHYWGYGLPNDNICNIAEENWTDYEATHPSKKNRKIS